MNYASDINQNDMTRTVMIKGTPNLKHRVFAFDIFIPYCIENIHM
jgi:hypothetical protein